MGKCEILGYSWANKKRPSRNLSVNILQERERGDNIDYKANLEF